MNEETKETIADRVFAWVEVAAQNINDFANEQIPPFIEEFLMWRFLDHGISVAIWLIGALIALVTALCYKKYWNEAGASKEPVKVAVSVGVVIIFGMISLMNLGISTIGHVKQMVKIKVAPKVYLVEETAKIIKE